MALTLLCPVAAAAQPYSGSTSPHAGSFEASGGVAWTRGYDAGAVNPTLTRPGASGTAPLSLFNISRAAVESSPGGVARVGLYLSRRVSVEATVEYSRPVLRARVDSDVEQAANADLVETITSYLVGGSVLYHLGSRRVVPFVSGGGGYLRQLHEQNADLLAGTEIHGGGGLKYWFGSGGPRFGLRADAQASSRSKTVAFAQKRRVVASVAVGAAFLF